MSLVEKLRQLKEEVEGTSLEERMIRGRLSELKALLAERQKRQESLAALKKEEADLLDQLG